MATNFFLSTLLFLLPMFLFASKEEEGLHNLTRVADKQNVLSMEGSFFMAPAAGAIYGAGLAYQRAISTVHQNGARSWL